MKLYLVFCVLHRLDRRTILSAVEIIRSRTVRLIIDTDEITSCVLPGGVYEMRISYRTGRPRLVCSHPVGYDAQTIRLAVDRGLIGSDQHLPAAIKKLIHQHAGTISDWINLPNATDKSAPINEPYASLLWHEAASRRQDQQVLTELIKGGLNQHQAEQYLQCYGVEAPTKLKSTPLSALPFVSRSAPALKYPVSIVPEAPVSPLEMLLWLQEQADRGRTICDRTDVPLEFQLALNICLESQWIKSDGQKIQLVSHALLQTKLREAFEALTANFFPTYSELEVEYAYSRLAGLQSSGAVTDLSHSLWQLLNQRVVMVSYSATSELTELLEQYSGLIQTLHWSPPEIITYSERVIPALTQRLPYEQITAFYRASSLQGKTGRCFIVVDFELFTPSDLVVLFERLISDDQLILVNHYAMASYAHSRLFHTRQLQNYFPTVALNHEREAFKMPSAASRAQIQEAVGQGHTIISDDFDIIEQINSSQKASGPPKLVTPDGTYHKHQPVLFEPAGPRGFDSFIGVIISTTDKGLMVSAKGVVMQFTNDFVRSCKTSAAYAIDVAQAAKIGLSRGVLVTIRDHEVEKYLRDVGVEILQHYSLPDSSVPANSPTGQRITPSVEGHG